MVTSLRAICNCIGLTGKISILKNFFGYRNDIIAGLPVPPIPLKRPISLLTQVKLLKYGPHIRVHIKIIDPLWGIQDPTAPLDLLIEALRFAYGNVGIGVVIKSTEYINLSEEFLDIDIEGCSGDPSDEQLALYNGLKNNVVYEYDSANEIYFTREIVLFFVRYLGGPDGGAGDGCATSYSTSPCAVIAWGNDEPRYIAAHEVGHLLELEHPDEDLDPPGLEDSRLMTTHNIKTPYLTGSEVEDMKSSSLMFYC